MKRSCAFCGPTTIPLVRTTIDGRVVYVCGACRHEHELETVT